jgi:RimJ/RimL family protein N-acetyltransferase
MGEVLDLLKEEGYKVGNLQVLRYDPKRIDVFPPPYLSKLYFLAQNSGRRSKQGIIPELFCGMMDISHDTIIAYLTNRPLIVLVEWDSPSSFHPLGFAFPSTTAGAGDQKMAFLAYGFFMDAWGKPSVLTLTLLGLAYFFREFGLLAIHGSRYADNARSARLIRQVGFHDVGQVPRYMLKNGKLVDMIVSSLLVEEFEQVALPLLESITNANASEAKRGEGIIEQPRSGSPVRNAGE